MTAPKHKPIQPGEVLRHDFIEPLGLSAYRVTRDTGISPQHVGRILSGARGVSAEVALRLGRYFGTSAPVWMGLQTHYDLDVADDKAGKEIRRQVKPRTVA